MKVLIVKTSSLGDVIHTFPAITDVVHTLNGKVAFDWVVEEGFQDVPAWHPNVNRIIPVALRRWRKAGWFKAWRSGEIKRFLTELRAQEYDLIIDAQGLFKSALITWVAKSKTSIGLDRNSAREPIASYFYKKTCFVQKGQHAVIRLRQLFAKIFNYDFDAQVKNYGLTLRKTKKSKEHYIVFFHGTTWPTKHWPEAYWKELAQKLHEKGWHIKLPWGNDEEKARAKAIAAICEGEVLPKMRLTNLAKYIAGASYAIAVDTGLSHLAAALSVPTISIYGPTNPSLTATWGENQIHLKADFSCAPCLQKKCTYQGPHPVEPPCFQTVSPERVIEKIYKNRQK